MKILYLITKSEAGGAQTHVSQLCEYFKNQGHEVAVLSQPGGWLEEKVKNLGCGFFVNKYFSNSLNPVKAFLAWKETKKIIQKFFPDIIHCHSSGAAFYGRLAAQGKIRTIYTAHGWGFNEGVSFWQKCLAIIIEKWLAHYTEKIICVSEFTRKQALKYRIAPSSKIMVIYNGVELAPEAAKMTNEKLKILFVGRLAAPKIPELLLKTLSKLSVFSQEKCSLTIVGNGSKKEKIEKMIAQSNLNSVKIVADLGRERVLGILPNYDVFVLPTNWEGLPYTVLEAMSAGLPVVASNVGGISEAVNAECGWLIKKGDESGWQKIMEKLIAGEFRLQLMGEKARRIIEQKFTLEQMNKKVGEIYKQIKI